MRSVGRYILALLLLPVATLVYAQAGVQENIVVHITSTNHNKVVQPEALTKLLEYDPEAAEDIENMDSQNAKLGYRVQVFSDNNAHTAKNEARSKSRNINARFPQYRTYVTYTSPYWRLKVGDFRTQQEANEAAEELRRAFPSYSKEIRVVRDRINFN